MRPNSLLLIIDLDNTVHDWLSSFVPAYYAMIDVASEILGVPVETLLNESKQLNERYDSVEHPYALLDTPSVQKRFPGRTRSETKDALKLAFDEFNRERDKQLRPYPGVMETLISLKRSNITVVAYSDAPRHNSIYRMYRLGIIPLISNLYAPNHVVEPERPGALPDYLALVPKNYLRALPAKDKKPNPKALLDICDSFHVEPTAALYVGDSITRDIYMAQQAGLHNSWARYGEMSRSSYWQKLLRVTHYTPERLAREMELSATRRARPETVIDSFAQLLKLYSFAPLPKTTHSA